MGISCFSWLIERQLANCTLWDFFIPCLDLLLFCLLNFGLEFLSSSLQKLFLFLSLSPFLLFFPSSLLPSAGRGIPLIKNCCSFVQPLTATLSTVYYHRRLCRAVYSSPYGCGRLEHRERCCGTGSGRGAASPDPWDCVELSVCMCACAHGCMLHGPLTYMRHCPVIYAPPHVEVGTYVVLMPLLMPPRSAQSNPLIVLPPTIRLSVLSDFLVLTPLAGWAETNCGSRCVRSAASESKRIKSGININSPPFISPPSPGPALPLVFSY